MKSVALYVHIPFCKQKCLYCDFTSFAKLDKYMDEYVIALNKEILAKTKGYKIKSLFIGGGTPSYLNIKALSSLIDTIKSLDYLAEAEKTIECNPGTVDKEKFEIIKAGGINRLSFGLQTTNDSLLKGIGRIHSYNQFLENYNLARTIGFDNINIDVMFGLPNQSLEDYIESLNKIIELGPEHISAYSLIIEEGTQFFNLYNQNKLNLPDEDTERAMYQDTIKILQSAGYHQYEISNFSKPNKECIHNKVYWTLNEYIGVGLAASTYIDNKRIKNISNLEKYIKNINNGDNVSEEEYLNSNEDNIEEFMFMGLRMINGIDENEFERRFNLKIDDIYQKQIKDNIKKGLLIRDNGKIYLTGRGIELSNCVMSDMILTDL